MRAVVERKVEIQPVVLADKSEFYCRTEPSVELGLDVSQTIESFLTSFLDSLLL